MSDACLPCQKCESGCADVVTPMGALCNGCAEELTP